jgi:hypothetical protein
MSEQKHIIKRQIIELKIQGTAEAQQLQVEVSRIYRQRIVPLIDKYCTEFSQPDHIHRIELLEVDLGYLDPRHLEEQLVAKLSPALRQALANLLGQQEQTAARQGSSLKAMSQLELFAFFARTGSLPWWADTSQPRLLDECLQHLIHTAPEPLRRLMQHLIREQRPLRRLVYHYADELLARLSGVLAPSLQPSLARDPQELIVVLQKTRVMADKSAAQLRQSVWTNILYVAGLEGEQHRTPEPFYQAVLIRVATELGLPYASLIADLHQVLQAGQEAMAIELKNTLETLYREHAHVETTGSETIAQRLAQLQAAGGPLTGLWAVLRTLAPRLSAPLQRQLLTALRELESALSPREILSRIMRPLQFRLSPQDLPPAASRDLLAELQKLAATGLSSEEVSTLIHMLREVVNEPAVSSMAPLPAAGEGSAGSSSGEFSELIRLTPETRNGENAILPEVAEPAIDLSFSEADELYIGNAGLVILWPFLSHFFTRLDLLAEHQFKDAAARQRAVGLLQYVATAESTFPEYLLPLNKILCGMALTEVFDFGPPLSDAEAEECTDLLQAIIAQAPILRDMSAAGFRGAFLLRQGMLSERDGAWLLRVERETYDIVLDRFPWVWEWVKLPWMAAPLRVEW